MNETDTIFINGESCGDCIRCLRECAVKAIVPAEGRMEIAQSLCVACGNCVSVCPQKAVRVRDDIWFTRQLVKKHDTKIASLCPSWRAQFPGISEERMAEALRLLGFTHISESSLGAGAVIRGQLEFLRNNPGLYISSCCPSIVRYIRKFRPKLTETLLPFKSPMVAHAALVRQWWGEDLCVVHISSCPAAKDEADDYGDLVDSALTFRELKRWMQIEGVEFEKIPGSGNYAFEPFPGKREGMRYPLPDGLVSGPVLAEKNIAGIRTVAVTGLRRVDDVLYHEPRIHPGDTVVLELKACREGCLMAAGALPFTGSILEREMNFEKACAGPDSRSGELPDVNVRTTHIYEEPIGFVSEEDTLAALEAVGIHTEAQQLDCNGCGYGTCRRFAKALHRGWAEPDMCVPYVKSSYRNKFSLLLSRIPSGVVVLNERLQVVETNRNFASMLGPETEQLFDSTDRMKGIDIRSVFPFHSLFTSVLEGGEDILDRDIQVKDRMVKASVCGVQKNKLAIGIFRNLFISQVRNDEIIRRTREVIVRNMETVQNIASLLGENASRTEAILNSILDSQTGQNEGGK